MNNALIPALNSSSIVSANLSQPNGYEPPKEIITSDNTHWVLAKSYTDSSRDLPDIKRVQLVDAWNHAALNQSSTPVFVYVMEGLLQPRTKEEKPCRVLFSWFSLNNITSWTPQMLTEQEYLKANMYVASIGNSRMEILSALCYVDLKAQNQAEPKNELLDVPELNISQKKGKKE